MAAPLAERMTLRFVKQVTVDFCPWERNVQSARQFLSYLGNNTMRRTNPQCIVKTNVKHDGTPPTVLINFVDGQNLLFKTSHLTLSELVQKFAQVNELKLKAEPAAS